MDPDQIISLVPAYPVPAKRIASVSGNPGGHTVSSLPSHAVIAVDGKHISRREIRNMLD